MKVPVIRMQCEGDGLWLKLTDLGGEMSEEGGRRQRN